MPGRIRVLDAMNRTMQRLGYLKMLCAVVNESETSNLASLGKRLIERVTGRVKLDPPFGEEIRDYARTRLTDSAYRDLRKALLAPATSSSVRVELQDLYLSDPRMPSRTGKLVDANWRRYPYFGTAIDLIKKGTYSALTRSLVLLAVTPKEELAAFKQHDPENNPLLLSDAQSLVLLYCLIDNDSEVLLPLFQALALIPGTGFDEREAGDLLPEIIRNAVKGFRAGGVTPEERDRLSVLTKAAANIEKWKGKAYTGSGAREEAIRVRLEPFCDLGFLAKPDRDRFSYESTWGLASLMRAWGSHADTDAFLQKQFFGAFAQSRRMRVSPADDVEAAHALADAGKALKSSLGYNPITDVGLLAGIRLLTEKGRTLELGRTTELLKSLQKQDPSFVRFTVDRMGVMAYVKFLKAEPCAVGGAT